MNLLDAMAMLEDIMPKRHEHTCQMVCRIGDDWMKCINQATNRVQMACVHEHTGVIKLCDSCMEELEISKCSICVQPGENSHECLLGHKILEWDDDE